MLLEAQQRYEILSQKCADLNDYINKITAEIELESGVSVSIIKGSKTKGNKFSASLTIDAVLFKNK